MKSKKILLPIALFIFCMLFTKSTLKTNAAQVFDFEDSPIYDAEFYNTDYHIFKKGYYLFVGEGDVSKFEFSGNISYHYYTGNATALSISTFEAKLGIESSYKSQFSDIIEEVKDGFGYDFPEGIIILIRVTSYGKMTYKDGEGCWRCYCYGIETHEENTSSTPGDKCHVISVDNRLTIDEIMARYEFTDNIDSSSNLTINYTTIYNPRSAIGYVPLYIEVTDASGNVSTALDYIYIHDFLAPTITSTQETYTIEVNDVLTSETIKSNFSVVDNYTNSIGMKITYEDNYNNNYDQVGSYSVTCTAKDYQGNISNKTVNINVVDTTKPTIKLKDGGNVIHANEPLNTIQILDLLEITDNYDTITSDQITIFTDCEGIEGVEYQIQITVTDSSNNTQVETFAYYINDTTPPNITVRDVIYLEKDRTYTSEEMLNILKTAGIISQDATNVNFITEELISSDDKVDVYKVTYEEITSDGSVNYGTITLKYQKEIKENKMNIYYIIIPSAIVLGAIILLTKKKRKKTNANK